MAYDGEVDDEGDGDEDEVTRVTVMNEYDENEGCDDGDNDDASGSGDDNNLIELCKSRLVMLRGKRAPKIFITCPRIIVRQD